MWVLQLAGSSTDIDAWAELISREINHVRDFNRRIGRRITRRMLAHGTREDPKDRIDAEIDEILENTELRTVVQVSNVSQRPKSQVASLLTEEDL